MRQPAVVTIGNFDGVHAGHRALVARARDLCARIGAARVVALVFDPSPQAVLTGRGPEHRMAGSIALATLAVSRGARIVRAHDVSATVDAVAVAWAARRFGVAGGQARIPGEANRANDGGRRKVA